MGQPTKEKEERNQKILKLRKLGWSFEKIGKKFRVSKQCIFRIVKRKLG